MTTPALVQAGSLGLQASPLLDADVLILSRDGVLLKRTTLATLVTYLLAAGLSTSARQIVAGAGLTGGGDLTLDRTLNIVAADGSITVGPDTIGVGVLQNDTQHGTRGGGTTHSLATGSLAGFLSASDFTKLQALSTNPSLAGDVGGTISATVLQKLIATYSVLSTTVTTGTTQPLSIADAVFTGKATGGSVSGNGVAGIVSASFASSTTETGTAANQGGLGSAASSTQPYNSTNFPGVFNIPVHLQKADGDDVLLIDVLSTATGLDKDAQVYGYLSFRSDLGANLKWRLWFYYRRASDGFQTPFTPDTSLTGVTLQAPEVMTLGSMPVSGLLGRPQFGQMAAEIGAKAVGTTQLDDKAATYAKIQDISATQRALARNSAGAGSAEEVTISQMLDWVGSAANGDILYRSGGVWVRLPVGAANTFLAGGALPTYATPPNAVAGGAAGYLTGADKLKLDNGSANVSAGSSITTTQTASNTVSDTTILTFTAGANTLAAGAVFEFDVWGDSDNVVTSAPTLSFWVKDQGGTKRVTVTFTHTTTAKTNQAWHLTGQIDIRTLTATGTDRFSMKIETMTTATPTFAIAVNNADVTIDTTASHTFTVGMTWGVANAANIARAHLGYFVQIK